MSTLQSPASRHLWQSHLRISCHGGLFLTKQLQISLGGRWHWAEETRSPRTVDLGDPGVAAVGSIKASRTSQPFHSLCHWHAWLFGWQVPAVYLLVVPAAPTLQVPDTHFCTTNALRHPPFPIAPLSTHPSLPARLLFNALTPTTS